MSTSVPHDHLMCLLESVPLFLRQCRLVRYITSPFPFHTRSFAVLDRSRVGHFVAVLLQ